MSFPKCFKVSLSDSSKKREAAIVNQTMANMKYELLIIEKILTVKIHKREI